MPQFKRKQKVKLFPEEEKEVEQSVCYDSDEEWVNVIHNGEELSMSVHNFRQLIVLYQRTFGDSIN